MNRRREEQTEFEFRPPPPKCPHGRDACTGSWISKGEGDSHWWLECDAADCDQKVPYMADSE